MSRNKNALYDANDIQALAASAVENAKARRAVALQEAELEQATGGLIGLVGGPSLLPFIPIIFGLIFIPKFPTQIL